MRWYKSRLWRNFDWVLIGVTVFLIALGLLVIYSTGFRQEGVSVPVDARNQIIFAFIGIPLFIIACRVDYRMWRKLTTPLYLLVLGLLLLVALIGKTALGATRWINLGFFQFQPAELGKLVLIVLLAKLFADYYERLDQPKYLILSLLYTAAPAILVLLQPDLGTALVYSAIWLAMALSSRVRKSHILVLLVIATAISPLAYNLLRPYQKARLATFLNPTADPLTTGYNVVQSTIAVGSGQLAGRGLLAGSQSQLNFLPSQHTDFIFAVLAEKLGFLGSVLVLAAFMVLLFRALVIARRAQDRFGMFLATGITAMLLFHIFVNIGMNLGIMPVTGIPLPFVSYGGTSLLTALIAIGMLESIAIRRKKLQF